MISLGVDFDNTIVCYDGVFHKAALDKGWLKPCDRVLTKDEVRNQLRAQGQEEEWIHLQGYVYGARMQDAAPYPGALEFFASAVKRGLPVRVISHRTKSPFRGPGYDLHTSAQDWLEARGFFDSGRIGLSRSAVFFELKKEEKLGRIKSEGCTHFVDDLPEFLSEPAFPAKTKAFLFDPACAHAGQTRFQRVGSWTELEGLLALETGQPAR